ncbi:MAG: Cys-tRNA(Pro) deacylase [Treponema sp.]|jgi:Cys-tRNA(Pro)/Cys-tRNA(Cys) deacylase|nr:Cys-tRNA(Pro) deacylase [Treponema sp.]
MEKPNSEGPRDFKRNIKRTNVKRTNVLRLLDAGNIPYERAEYPVDESDLSAQHAAEFLGIPAERVFKTLVLRGESGAYLVCCIPAGAELDLKKAARWGGEKRVDLVPLKDLQPLTGYIRGGCSPIGMKKQFPTFIDETAELFETITVSAGVRGLLIIISPRDLLDFIPAKTADLTSSGKSLYR